MDNIKIENFNKDNPGTMFPTFTSVAECKCAAIKDGIAEWIGLRPTADGLAVVKGIRDKSKLLQDVDAESETFSLEKLGLPFHDSVYLNWGRFESLDCMKAEAVIRWFDYLWYPAVDDLDIIDCELEWVASISHSGEVYLLRR